MQIPAVLITGLWALTASSVGLADADSIFLFNEDEAVELQLSAVEWEESQRVRGEPVGPRVFFMSPVVEDRKAGATILTRSPLALLVTFEANRAPVDMDSLEVRARKRFPPISKSLTKVLRDFISDTGINVPELEIPAGKFLIDISISDQEGNKTVETYRLHVLGD